MMTLDSVVGYALAVLQILASAWVCILAVRLVFGVGFDSKGQIVGKKPIGRFIVRCGNGAVKVVDETTRATAKVVKDLAGSPDDGGETVFALGKETREEQRVRLEEQHVRLEKALAEFDKAEAS